MLRRVGYEPWFLQGRVVNSTHHGEEPPTGIIAECLQAFKPLVDMPST
jgi:hypothetical protein